MSLQSKRILWVALLAGLTVLAASAVAADDLNGNWHFIVHTEAGDREFSATFKVDGDQVSGKLADADVKGTFKSGALDLAFPFTSSEAGNGTLTIKGALADAALSGNWEFNGYSGTFNAARQ